MYKNGIIIIKKNGPFAISLLCVLFFNGKCAVGTFDAGTFMTWEHTHKSLCTVWHISYFFFSLSLSFHSFFSLVAHDDASIKKWKAIIFPIREEKKKKPPKNQARLCDPLLDRERDSEPFFSRQVHSTKVRSPYFIYTHGALLFIAFYL
jgi:hypothetical protein